MPQVILSTQNHTLTKRVRRSVPMDAGMGMVGESELVGSRNGDRDRLRIDRRSRRARLLFKRNFEVRAQLNSSTQLNSSLLLLFFFVVVVL